MVIAPANTGKATNNKNTGICTGQTNKGSLSIGTPGDLILNTVVIKFISPRIEDAQLNINKKLPYQVTLLNVFVYQLKGIDGSPCAGGSLFYKR